MVRCEMVEREREDGEEVHVGGQLGVLMGGGGRVLSALDEGGGRGGRDGGRGEQLYQLLNQVYSSSPGVAKRLPELILGVF